jgi:5-methylcytosine-specific restriction endonuclease McrA
MQRCSVCCVEKPFSEFHRHKRRRLNGLSSTCKDCAKVRASKWYAENRERGRATRSEWHEANRPSQLEAMKRYRSETVDQRKISARKWREKNKTRKRMADAAWQQKNQERMRVYRRVSEAKRRASTGSHTSKDIDDIKKLQRNCCAICKMKLAQFEIDHINPLSRGGSNDRSNIQLLCSACNGAKHARDPLEHMRSLGRLI